MTDHTDLIARLRKALSKIQEGDRPLPWVVHSGCSYRRIASEPTRENPRSFPDGNVLHATKCWHDGHPDLSMSEDQLNALVSIINAIPQAADALEAATPSDLGLGASSSEDRAFVPSASSPQAVSPVPASIPSAEDLIASYADGSSPLTLEEVAKAVVGPAMSYPLSSLEPYDAGLLNDWGGGNVEWWQDYIRAELERARDHYQFQVNAFMCGVEMEDGWIAQNGYTCPVDPDVLIDGIIWREGGRHTWGAYIRAGDMKDRDWAVVAAYRIHSPAQGGEAGTAETGTGSVHEHPVHEVDAPNPSHSLAEQGEKK